MALSNFCDVEHEELKWSRLAERAAHRLRSSADIQLL